MYVVICESVLSCRSPACSEHCSPPGGFCKPSEVSSQSSATCFHLPFYFMDLTSLCKSWSLVRANPWSKGTALMKLKLSLLGWKELGELHLHYMCLPEKTLHVWIQTFDPNEIESLEDHLCSCDTTNAARGKCCWGGTRDARSVQHIVFSVLGDW